MRSQSGVAGARAVRRWIVTVTFAAPGFSAGADGTEIQPAPLKEKALPRNPGEIAAVTAVQRAVVAADRVVGHRAAGRLVHVPDRDWARGRRGRRRGRRRHGGRRGGGWRGDLQREAEAHAAPGEPPGPRAGGERQRDGDVDDEPPAPVHRDDARGAGPRQPQPPARPVAEAAQAQRRARQERRRRRAQAPPAGGELDALGRAGRGEEPADDARPAAARDDRDPSPAGARHGQPGLVGAGRRRAQRTSPVAGQADPDAARRREPGAVEHDQAARRAGRRAEADLRGGGGRGWRERQDREACQHRGEGGANVHTLSTFAAPPSLRAPAAERRAAGGAERRRPRAALSPARAGGTR